MTESGPFGIVVVSTSMVLREGLGRILLRSGHEILASADNLDRTNLADIRTGRSVLLLIDGSQAAGAIAQIERFKTSCATPRIAVIAEDYDLNGVVAFLRAGANACLRRNLTCEALTRFLDLVMMGETIVPHSILPLTSSVPDGDAERRPPTRDPMTPASPTHDFTAREKRLLQFLIRGESNMGIAQRLAITENTVKVHLKTVLRKINVQNRTQAAIWAMRNRDLILSEVDRVSASPEVVGSL
jgi:two-component system nitrate/nitrite response regulator NarL